MQIVLPVESATSTDPSTFEDVAVRRVTVQFTEAEAESVAAGDAAAVAEMAGIVGDALVEGSWVPVAEAHRRERHRGWGADPRSTGLRDHGLTGRMQG